jgi:twitching motility protein PilT
MTSEQRPSISVPRVPSAPPPPLRTAAAGVLDTSEATRLNPPGMPDRHTHTQDLTRLSPPGLPPLPPRPTSQDAGPVTELAAAPMPQVTPQTAAQTMPLAAPAAVPAVPAHRPAASPFASMAHKPSPGAPTLATVVRMAYDKGFSDVHVGVGEVPRFRDRGEIAMTEWPEVTKETFYSWLQEILSTAEIERFEDTLDFDGATQYDFARVRINIFDSLHGPSMVLRLIPMKILTCEQLGLPPVFRDVCHYHKGLILITGPTGSGKSTTMAAMVDYMNSTMTKNIITIEDPIEFVHKSRKCLIKHREVGINTRQFDSALKAALREDPDCILVGEMRDRETINTALKAAQTGHLVMGTLHTNSAVKTIERVLGMYQPEEQPAMRVALAESLVTVISQGLCRTTDGKRAAFHDIMINTDAIKDYIRRGDLDEIEQIMPNCGFDGMCTMNQALYKLYEEGRITEEVALEMAPKINEMAQLLRGRC